jgi:hypothetical protein
MLRKKKFLFIIPLLIILIIVMLTFGKFPMLGECEQRGLLEREPNIALINNFFKWQKRTNNNDHWNILECKDCFLTHSEMGAKSLRPGIGHSVFQPVLFYQDGKTKWPLLFQFRQGGSGLILVKLLNRIARISLLESLTIFHFGIIALSLLFFWLFASKYFGHSIAFVGSLFYALSPIVNIAGGPFITEKILLVVPWVFLYLSSFRSKSSWILLGCLLGFTFYAVKASVLLFFTPVLFFYFNNFKKNFKWLILSTTLALIPLFILWNSEGAYTEFVRNASYLKGFKFCLTFLRDYLFLWVSPLQSQEYFLNWSHWLYPMTTGEVLPRDYQAWTPLNALLNLTVDSWILLFFIIGIVFVNRNLIKKPNSVSCKLFFASFSTAFLLFIGGHEIKTMSHYLFPLYGLTALFFAYQLSLLKTTINRFQYRTTLIFLFVITGYEAISFVQKYRISGPALTFNASFYHTLSKKLKDMNIIRPIMYYDAEYGMLDALSNHHIVPYYFPEFYMSSYDDTWKIAKEGTVLLQVNPDWYESGWPKNISFETIQQSAKGKGIYIEKLDSFNYRGKKQYELFHFKQVNQSFAKGSPPLDEVFYKMKKMFKIYR